jgi:hypothetical protein
MDCVFVCIWKEAAGNGSRWGGGDEAKSSKTWVRMFGAPSKSRKEGPPEYKSRALLQDHPVSGRELKQVACNFMVVSYLVHFSTLIMEVLFSPETSFVFQHLHDVDNLTFVLRNRHGIPLFSIETGSGAHSASQAMGTGFCSGLKRQEREADHSLPTSVERSRTPGSIHPLLHTLNGVVLN